MLRWLDSGRLRSVELDRRAALALHQVVSRPRALAALTWASRLGDGPMWLAIIALQPLIDAQEGMRRAGLLLLYWALKRGTRRPRPFEHCQGIRACMKPPDPFSFPSGHTLHAVAFAALLSAFFPVLAPALWAFAGLVAVSRVALGLHYPSDVVAGAAIGGWTASIVAAVAWWSPLGAAQM